MQKKNKKTKKKPFNYKKLLIFIFCFTIVIFSAKPVFNWSLTSLIKISSKKLTNHNISFKTYKIRNKTIILKDVIFFDENRTLAHTDEIDLLINYKIIKPKITADILVKNPDITLFKTDDLKLKIHSANKSKIFSYTLKIENGQINLLNKENEQKIVYFDFLKKDPFLSKFQISFDKEKVIPIDINRINKKISFRTTLDEIEIFHLNDLLSFFNKKIFEEIDGQANGLMVVDIENDRLTNFYANLDLIKLKAKNLNTDLTCEMDKLHFELEYPDCNNEIFDSIYLDFLKSDILKSTKLRAEVDNLNVISPNKTVLTDISGFLSFNPGFGFKMNFLGKGENFKKFNFEIFSKAFFSSSNSNWLDLNFSFDDLSNKISLKTKQIEKDDYLLSMQFDNLMPHIALTFQDVLSKVFPEVKKARFLNGEINLIADAKFSKAGFEQVNLSDLKLNNFEFEISENFKGFISKLEDKSSFNLKHENFWDKFFSDLKIYSAYFDINGNKITDFNTQMLIADGNFQSSYASLFINNMKSEITFDGNIENFNMLSKTKGKLKHFKDDFSVIMTCLRRNQKYQCSGNVQIEDNQDAVFEFALNKALVFNFQDFKNSISSFWIRAEKVKLHKWPKIFDYNLDIDGLANLFVFYKNEKLTCQIKGENLKYKNDYIDVSIKNIGNINNHIFEDKKCIEAIYQNNKLFTYFPKFEGSCKLSKYDLLFDLKDSKIDVIDNVLYAKLPNCSALDVNLDGNVCFDFRKKYPLLKITVNNFNSSIKSFQNFSKKFDFSSDLQLEGSIFGKSEISLAFSDKLQTSWNIELNVKDAFYQINKFSKLENIFAKAKYSSFDDKFEIIDKFTADLNLNNKILKLNCPIFIKKNQNYSFDMRLEKNIFDIFRIKGKLLKIDNKYQLKLSKKSHFFSEDLTNLDLVLNENFSIDQLNFKQNESFYSFFSKLQFLIDLNFLDFKNLNLDFLKNSYTNGDIKYQIFFDDSKKLTFEFLSKKLKILNSNFERFYLKAYKDNSQILVEKIHLDDFDGNIALDIKDDFCKFQNIEIKKKEALFLKMKGNYLFSDAKFNMVIDDIKIDLKKLSPYLSKYMNFSKNTIEGYLKGNGVFHAKLPLNGSMFDFSTDLDFQPSNLNVEKVRLYNSGSINVNYSTSKGFLIHGLDLSFHSKDVDLSYVNLKIAGAYFNFNTKKWLFKDAYIFVPQSVISSISQFEKFKTFEKFVSFNEDIDLICQVESKSDFSKLNIFSKECNFLINSKKHNLKNIAIDYTKTDINIDFDYFYKNEFYHIKNSFYLNNDILGTTSFSENQKDENPLKIKWSLNQNKIFEINEMTGNFCGIDILFQKENEKVLFGSVKLDLFKLKKIMPIPIENAISKFDLRKGYEFSGRLFLDFSKNKNFKFQGLFSGKDFELLGYRFKTMLSSVEIDPNKLDFQNLKISDTSGILSIKNFLLEKSEISWQINIPNLKIKDLRPSLMQKIDHPLGEMTPFLVRELNLNDFKGNVNDRNSFSGKGNLHFINSFKRNHSVFEFPADVLSRIVGLDQELLTPVKGKVDLKVSDGKFYIKDLQDSFSEGERSKFFLHDKGQKPYVDFDGNIYLNIAMKQYVLFKFTESFVISIRGDLQEPKYNLKKKRGFLN